MTNEVTTPKQKYADVSNTYVTKTYLKAKVLLEAGKRKRADLYLKHLIFISANA